MTGPLTGFRRFAFRILTALSVLTLAALPAIADEKKTIGWIERIEVTNEALAMDAKVDTGADSSFVHAEDIRYFERDATPWVEFTLRDSEGRKRVLKRRLVRMVRIKKKSKGFQKRPVVTLRLCVGDTQRDVAVNLAARGHFTFPVLLGRRFLKDSYLVDPGAKYLLAPVCR